jgi:hypothetical protein
MLFRHAAPPLICRRRHATTPFFFIFGWLSFFIFADYCHIISGQISPRCFRHYFRYFFISPLRLSFAFDFIAAFFAFDAFLRCHFRRRRHIFFAFFAFAINSLIRRRATSYAVSLIAFDYASIRLSFHIFIFFRFSLSIIFSTPFRCHAAFADAAAAMLPLFIAITIFAITIRHAFTAAAIISIAIAFFFDITLRLPILMPRHYFIDIAMPALLSAFAAATSFFSMLHAHHHYSPPPIRRMPPARRLPQREIRCRCRLPRPA